METNSIQLFKSEQFGDVRVVMNESGEPIFCLADVCSILDLTTTQVVRRLGSDVFSKHPIIDSLNREQLANFVNEDGLYDVILDSRKKEAKKFRKWVTSEILPSIRKHGVYMTDEKLEQALLNPDTLIKLALNLKEEQQKRLEAEKTISAMKPKALFASAVESSANSCLIGELSKILCQNGVDIGQNRLFEWMREKGYLCIRGELYNQPTQVSMELGLFELIKRVMNNPDGSTRTTCTTKVTGKGQIYFVNKFLSNENNIAS